MTISLGYVALQVFKEIQKFPIDDKQRLYGIYAGCLVNNYGKDMNYTVSYCDVEC